MNKTVCFLLFFFLVGCQYPKNIQKVENQKKHSGTVLVFFDPMCSDCKIGELDQLKKLGVDVDIVHYLEIVKAEKSYGVSYLYEAIKLFDSELASEYLKVIHNKTDDKIEFLTRSFITQKNIQNKLQQIMSQYEIEKTLAYDKILSEELRINSVPSFFYNEKLFMGDTALENVIEEILNN